MNEYYIIASFHMIMLVAHCIFYLKHVLHFHIFPKQQNNNDLINLWIFDAPILPFFFNTSNTFIVEEAAAHYF